HLPPFYGDEEGADRSLYWLNLNTNKRSITLDIEKPEDPSAFEKLVAGAAVVVETFYPRHLDQVGLGYEGLTRIKRDIILTSITGIGQTEPHAHYKGVIPLDVPGIGPYDCSDAWGFAYVGSPAGATWGDLLAWMIEEGKAEDLADEPYKSFCEGLNLRFLSALLWDPATIAEKFQRMAHINQVLRRFVKTKAKWEMYEQAQ